MKKNTAIDRMAITAVLMAVGLLLPFLTGQLPTLGQFISPLHIPVLICGLTCGGMWGALLGATLPLLRMAVFGMPMLPVALPMAFELCAYGAAAGVLYPVLCRLAKGKRFPAMLMALAIAMIAGRIIGGAAKALLILGGVIGGSPMTFAAFLTAYFAETAVGALIHLIVVPMIVLALEKACLSPLARTL